MWGAVTRACHDCSYGKFVTRVISLHAPYLLSFSIKIAIPPLTERHWPPRPHVSALPFAINWRLILASKAISFMGVRLQEIEKLCPGLVRVFVHGFH